MTTYVETDRGLRVEQQGHGWAVVHAGSGLAAVTGLRQRRFAEEARADLLATGVDFTREPAAIQHDSAKWAGARYKWLQRAHQDYLDPWTFEHYSSSTHYGQVIPSAEKAAEMREARKHATWHATGHPKVQRNGYSGGDFQVAENWNVQLYSDQVPTAVIDIDVFAEDLNVHEDLPKEYGVTAMIQYTVCTSRDDPGGTEVWADIQYSTDDDVRAYETPEEADEAARRVAEDWAANADAYISWDGISPIQH